MRKRQRLKGGLGAFTVVKGWSWHGGEFSKTWAKVCPIWNSLWLWGGFPGGLDGEESACNAADLGSIPGSGRSPREGRGNPLQCSCLENSMDRGAWRATVPSLAKSQTRLKWLNRKDLHRSSHLGCPDVRKTGKRGGHWKLPRVKHQKWSQGLPWWSGGWDSALSVQGAQVLSLVRELDLTCCS